MTILVFILILSVLIFVHELGHFLMAKIAGVRVEEFGIGYPPKAIKLFTFQGTDFTLNLIPFGGFVKLAGEDGPDDSTAKPSSRSSHHKKGELKFYQAHVINKLLIILAGATVNFLFGMIIFTSMVAIQGLPTQIDEARIGDIAPNSPAAQAGLPKDVTVLAAIDAAQTQVSFKSFPELVKYVEAHQGENITLITTGPCTGLVCEDAAQKFEVALRTDQNTPAGEGILGVSWGVAFVKSPWYQMIPNSVVFGVKQSLFMGQQILFALRQLGQDAVNTGQVPAGLAGPVGIVHQAQKTGIFQEGLASILFFAGVLSINLAIMNILPIPPLDGGRAVFVVLEMVFHRDLLRKLEHYVNYSGYVLLMGLIIFITIRDIWQLF